MNTKKDQGYRNIGKHKEEQVYKIGGMRNSFYFADAIIAILGWVVLLYT